MRDSAEEAGLTKMRRQTLTPNTRPSFEVGEFAKEKGLFDQFHKSVFQAFWEEGKNIGADGVLEQVLQSSGLDWEEYASSEHRSHYTQKVEGQLMESRMYGITGVPAFILDRYLISGAQPYQVFQQVMEHIQKERSSEGP
jgi:predicted DsbA family dithiol-disulfide isomerase